MKKLEFTFYCSNPKEKCPKTFCIIDGHACLFLKAQWETKFKESKRRQKKQLETDMETDMETNVDSEFYPGRRTTRKEAIHLKR